MTTLTLRKGRARSLDRRHPWIFSGALEPSTEEIQPGEVVSLREASGAVRGYGLYSPMSQIRVRMLSFDPAQIPDGAFIATRVKSSVARRAAFFADGPTSVGVRVINAEADGLPGLVADVYAGFVVCQFTSAGLEAFKDEVCAALMLCVPACRGVSERRDTDARQREGLSTEPAFLTLAGEEPPEEIAIQEGPCTFLVAVRTGHKTGFYLDQRDARAKVGALAKGREVLNCFSYTGGFGLSARAGGAKKVTQVDISAEALALARRNEALQPTAATEMDYVEADVFRYLRTCRDAGKSFDLIVLDPPKFAAVKSQVMKAARGYKDINLLAMKLLKPNGILATFSCSGAMDAPLFDQILAEAAQDAHRTFQVLSRTRAGSDHSVSVDFPEGDYLKGVILQAVDYDIIQQL